MFGLAVVAVGEQARGGDGVAPEGRDERVRHGAHAAPAPPRRLRVGRDADRAGDVGGPAVAGLHQPVVVAGREEEDGLAVRRLDHRLDVAHDQRAPRHAAQVHRLQMREQPVVALDRHDGLARRDLVALVQGADLELVPAVLPAAVDVAPGALLEHGDRLVDAAEDRVLLLEDLHEHARAMALELEQVAGQVEVLVGVVALAHALDGQPERLGGQAAPRGDPMHDVDSLIDELRPYVADERVLDADRGGPARVLRARRRCATAPTTTARWGSAAGRRSPSRSWWRA